MKDVYVNVAATTSRGSAASANDDALGINGWVLTGDSAPLWSAEHIVVRSEGYVVADGIQPGLGGLASRLVAEQASAIDLAKDRESIYAMILGVHESLVDDAGFLRRRGIPVDTIPGTTLVALRVGPDQKVTIFNVGDSRLYELRSGRLGLRSRDDRFPPGGGALSRSIGGGPAGVPDAYSDSWDLRFID